MYSRSIIIKYIQKNERRTAETKSRLRLYMYIIYVNRCNLQFYTTIEIDSILFYRMIRDVLSRSQANANRTIRRHRDSRPRSLWCDVSTPLRSGGRTFNLRGQSISPFSSGRRAPGGSLPPFTAIFFPGLATFRLIFLDRVFASRSGHLFAAAFEERTADNSLMLKISFGLDHSFFFFF